MLASARTLELEAEGTRAFELTDDPEYRELFDEYIARAGDVPGENDARLAELWGSSK
jgi:hypothetical protein